MPAWSNSNGFKAIANLGILLISGSLILPLQFQRFEALTRSNNLDIEAEEQRLEREEARLDTLKYLPAFGFDALLADWTFLNFLSYFGDEPLRLQTGFGLSPRYFEVILERSPYFWEAYFFLSASTSLFAGQPQQAVALFDRHLPELTPTVPPKAYVLWRYKATDELLFLGNSDAALESYRTAAEWAEADGSPEAVFAAQGYRESIQFLETDPDSVGAQISAWGNILGNAFDESTQRLAIEQIRALGGDVIVDEQGRVSIQSPE